MYNEIKFIKKQWVYRELYGSERVEHIYDVQQSQFQPLPVMQNDIYVFLIFLQVSIQSMQTPMPYPRLKSQPTQLASLNDLKTRGNIQLIQIIQ